MRANARPEMLSEAEATDLAEAFAALSDPTRVRILYALGRAELCVSDLGALLDLSAPAVSHHLRLLRALRLVKHRRAGRLIYYALDDHHIEELFEQGLAHVRERDDGRAG